MLVFENLSISAFEKVYYIQGKACRDEIVVSKIFRFSKLNGTLKMQIVRAETAQGNSGFQHRHNIATFATLSCPETPPRSQAVGSEWHVSAVSSRSIANQHPIEDKISRLKRKKLYILSWRRFGHWIGELFVERIIFVSCHERSHGESNDYNHYRGFSASKQTNCEQMVILYVYLGR